MKIMSETFGMPQPLHDSSCCNCTHKYTHMLTLTHLLTFALVGVFLP